MMCQPDKTNLFMIHGMWGTRSVWRNYRRYFKEQGYRCVTPNLPLHKRSLGSCERWKLGCFGLDSYVRVLRARYQRDFNKQDSVIIVGHSMGGLLAPLMVGKTLEPRPKAMVLLTPAPSANICSFDLRVTLCFLLSFPKILCRLKMKPWAWVMRHAIFNNIPTREERLALYRTFVAESGKAAWEIGGLPFKGENRRSWVDVTTLDFPLLILSAQQDNITPASVVLKNAIAYGYGHRPDLAYETLPGHAHWVLGEPGWEDIARKIRDWIKELR